MAAVYKVGKKWRADWIDTKGVRHRRRFKTKGDTDDFLTKIGPELKDGTWVAPKDIPTFGTIADAWLRGRIEISRMPGSGYRPSTLQQWQSHVAHLKFSFENRRADTISAAAFGQAMAQWRLPKAQGGRGIGGKTSGKIRTTASRIFRYAMANKLGVKEDPTKLMETEKLSSGEQVSPVENVAQDAATKLPVPSRNKLLHKVTEKEVLTPQETKALILATEPGVYRLVILAACFTGARISELLALRWSDLDLDKGIVTIQRSLSTARVKGLTDDCTHPGKNEKWRWFDPKTYAGNRRVPIPPQLVTALKEWREKCPESRFELVFCNVAGEPLDRTMIGREVLAPAIKRAGIEKKITPHCLRHTYASTLVMLGRDIAQVSKYLGHSDVYVTMTIYTHFIKTKQDTMDDLEQLVRLN
jgi:integrase